MDLLDLYPAHEPRARVYCWTCQQHIYNLKEVSFGKTTLSSDLFEPIKGIDPPQPGDKARCPLCGGRFISPEGELIVAPEEKLESIQMTMKVEK